ncbi:MAG: anthranilate phosphoribosyltransferase, partial [Deltaproteobacteria bacterium]
MALRTVVAGQSLDADTSQRAVEHIMSGDAPEAQIAAFLTALRMKGETVDEITGAVRAMRERVVPIHIGHDVVLDTCGTGGDGAGTFNISTAVSFVCAAAGVTVAKHGNRAISSRVGSADVLERLGVRIDLGPDAVVQCIQQVGVGFMFAPLHHAALRHAGPTRRALGFRTVLNLLGPLTNPAGATHQLVGIYDPARLDTVAEVLQRLGTRRAMVVHGEDGLDEVSIAAPTQATVLFDGRIERWVLAPEELGVTRAPLSAVMGGDGAENAALVRAVLAGEETGPPADIVRLNAGCALWVAEAVKSVPDGVALATSLLANGAALAKLDALVV